MADTDVLHHANGDHAIKAAGELAVVDLEEFHLLAHSSRLRTFARHADLGRRDVNGRHTAPANRGGKSRRPQPEPISATVMPGRKTQLSRDPVEACLTAPVRSFRVGVLEEGARIVEPLVQEQPINSDIDIVMVSRMRCGGADGIRLMPAARGPPNPPEQALRSMPEEACHD